MHPIENIMQITMSEIKQMVDVNTIVGDAIVTPDGSTILPVSKVSFGFVTGGGEYGEKKESATQDAKHPFGGGGGAGVTIYPIAFLIIHNDDVKMMTVDHPNTYETMLDKIPTILTQVKKMFEQSNQEKKGTEH
ncbi:MAG: GerW family sporulation protein [Eubacteriales bacterium]